MTNRHFSVLSDVSPPLETHSTYLDEVSVIPTILLTRTLRLRKVKEKAAPSHTVAEQEGYPRCDFSICTLFPGELQSFSFKEN